MRKILLGAAAISVVTTLMSVGALAAPTVASFHAAPSLALVTEVDYRWHHHHYSHRHWAHGSYRYY